MDYTHKFSSGALHMDHMIEEYLSLRKTRGYCQKCPKYGKYWSCPEFGFDEKIFLNEFKFMYPIGREYQIPKKDRQKVIGIQACANYCTEVHNAMKVESWRDLLQLEKDIPGTITLMPGNCHICDVAGIGCARTKGLKCRHAHMMRFSLEALGFDVDAISKFEIGLLMRWPREGHLPEKLSCVMAVLSNEKIPMGVIKQHFPDQKKSYLKAGQTILGGEEAPKAKRVDSWLDHQAEELMEKEEQEDFHSSWLGFKSEALDSGDYVKDRTWAEGDEEYPDAPPEVDDVLEGDRVAAVPPAETKAPVKKMEPAAPAGPQPEDVDEDGNPKYKWLGFKRSPDEATEIMMDRPIPKFSLSEEEKAAKAAAEKQEASDNPDQPADEQAGETPEPAESESPDAGPGAETDPPAGGEGPDTDPGVARGHNPMFDKQTFILEEMEQALRREMPDASDAQIYTMLKDALSKEIEAGGQQQPESRKAEPKTVRASVDVGPKPEPEVQKEPEPVVLPDASSVADVLGAALKIAQAVVSEPEPEPEPEQSEPAAEQEKAAAPEAESADAPPEPQPDSSNEDPEEEEDDSKYKWLGFKQDVKEDDGFKKGGWKKNY